MLGDPGLGCVYRAGGGGGGGGGQVGGLEAPALAAAAAFHHGDHLLWHGNPFPYPCP